MPRKQRFNSAISTRRKGILLQKEAECKNDGSGEKNQEDEHNDDDNVEKNQEDEHNNNGGQSMCLQ
eukprot:4743862-Ditylum_brightwellii.AAC.1